MKRLILAVGTVAALVFGALGLGAAEAAYPSADNLRVASQSCAADGSVSMTLAWNSYNQGTQHVDVSVFSNAFQPGTYLSFTNLPSIQNTYTVAGLHAGMPYYVRVVTQTAGGMVATPTSVFYASGCTTFVPLIPAPYLQPYFPANVVYGSTIGTWINGRYYSQVVSAVNTPFGVRYVYTPVALP